MRKQTYFNQAFRGRALQMVTGGERGQLIATFDVMFGSRSGLMGLPGSIPLLPLDALYHTLLSEKLPRGLRVLNAVIFIKSLLLFPVGLFLNFNLHLSEYASPQRGPLRQIWIHTGISYFYSISGLWSVMTSGTRGIEHTGLENRGPIQQSPVVLAKHSKEVFFPLCSICPSCRLSQTLDS